MNSSQLFRDSDGICYGYDDVLTRLRKVGAHDCDVLFIHSEVMFGTPNKAFRRTEYLDSLFHTLLELGVETLVVPTFTFSFCNNEVFDVRRSRSYMGSLSEFIRIQPGVRRSLDPLLSVAVAGRQMDLLDGDFGHHSLGPGSFFDRLHKTKGVKFLFFGAEFSECFTYVHHVEKVLEVPYRFDKGFTGTVIDYAGHAYEDTHYIHTACGGVRPASFYHFKADLIERGVMRRERLGNSEVACIAEAEAYHEIETMIATDINYFLEQPFTADDLRHEYTMGKNGERITHC